MNTDAERSVLGAILLNSSAFTEAAEQLTPGDFLLDSHRRIYSRMVELADSSRAIDLITLADELGRHGELEIIGGVAYITSLLDGVPDRPTIAEYIELVRDAAERRRAAQHIDRAKLAVNNPSIPTSALADMGSVLAQISTGQVIPPRFSEDALALRFAKRYADVLRHVHGWGKWLRWDGTRWAEDTTLHIFDLARGVCRGASAECGDAEKVNAVRLASKQTSAAVERLAASDRRHAATAEQWDSDPWLLNTPTGTVDLRTGEVREHRPSDYLTKITTAGPSGGDCPLWRQFLDRVTAGNVELQQFLQRMIGYCLTGSTREHALFLLYGIGANGKSVFLTTISAVLGDYAKTAPASSFMACANEQHPTDLAGLRGARFVTAIETEDGARWAESRIKSLTGGDKIAARFMRCDFFEFRPEFKLAIAGNHKPSLRSVDEAIRRRLHLVPFTVSIPASERDHLLTEKLQAEFPGILQWAIEGCLDWQREGLGAPSAVREATDDYLREEDAIGRWLQERCVVNANAWASSASLFSDWKLWSEKNGERTGSQKEFSRQLRARGFHLKPTTAARGFTGLALDDGCDRSFYIDRPRARVCGRGIWDDASHPSSMSGTGAAD
jgi:P4 family phage/plasmid primase-like protien